MPRRAEFYFDGTYYRKRIKLPDGRWKDVRARTKEELRSKLYDMETAQRMGLVLDAETTVAELAVEWYTNRSAGLSAARQGDYRIAINHHICPVIGAMRVRDVKPEHCQRVMAQALRDEKKRTNSEFVLHTSDGSHPPLSHDGGAAAGAHRTGARQADRLQEAAEEHHEADLSRHAPPASPHLRHPSGRERYEHQADPVSSGA